MHLLYVKIKGDIDISIPVVFIQIDNGIYRKGNTKKIGFLSQIFFFSAQFSTCKRMGEFEKSLFIWSEVN